MARVRAGALTSEAIPSSSVDSKFGDDRSRVRRHRQSDGRADAHLYSFIFLPLLLASEVGTVSASIYRYEVLGRYSDSLYVCVCVCGWVCHVVDPSTAAPIIPKLGQHKLLFTCQGPHTPLVCFSRRIYCQTKSHKATHGGSKNAHFSSL